MDHTFEQAWFAVCEMMKRVLERRREAVDAPYHEDVEKCDEEIDDIMGDFYANYLMDWEADDEEYFAERDLRDHKVIHVDGVEYFDFK